MIDLLLGQHDGQQAVLVAVVEEDVGEAGGDHGAKAKLVQRPGRVLARGAAAEVLAREQDGRTLIALLVEYESGFSGRLLLSMPGSPWSR